MINKVFFQGNLTKDPDYRNTPSGVAVCTLTVANNRRVGEKEETTFIDVTIWGKSADYCRNYLSKGSSVLIEGRLTLETWQNKDGNSRSKIAITAENVQGLSRNNNNNNNNGNGNSNNKNTGHQNANRRIDPQYAPDTYSQENYSDNPDNPF